jgi:hypothetical protein
LEENLVFFLAVQNQHHRDRGRALGPKDAMVLRDPPTIKHAPIPLSLRFLKPFFVQAGGQEPETMAVMRDPIDWLGG